MAQQPGRFSFFAPTPQAFDFSPIQRGAEAQANAMAAAGQAIASGIYKGVERADIKAKEKQRDTDIANFQQKMTAPEMTQSISFSPLESRFGPQLAEADAKYAADFASNAALGANAPKIPTQAEYRKTAITDYLTKQGYEPDRAGQIYDLLNNPIQGKIIQPEKMMELRAEGLALVAKGYMSSDELNSLVNNSKVFSDQSEFNRYVTESTNAVMDPGTLSPKAMVEVEKQAKIDVMKEQFAQENQQLKDQIAAQERRDTAAQTRALELLAKEQAGRESLATLNAGIEEAKAIYDVEREKQLLEEKTKAERALNEQRGRIERRLMEFKDDLESQAGSKTSGPNVYGKSEQEAIDQMARSLTGGQSAARDVSIVSVLGDTNDAVLDAKNIAKEIGPLAGKDIEQYVAGSRVYIDTTSGEPRVEVEVKGLEGDPAIRAELDKALTNIIIRRYGKDAVNVIAAGQVTSGAASGQSLLNILKLANEGQLPMGAALSQWSLERASAARGATQRPPPPPSSAQTPAPPSGTGTQSRGTLPGEDIVGPIR